MQAMKYSAFDEISSKEKQTNQVEEITILWTG